MLKNFTKHTMTTHNPRIAFFGSPDIAVTVLSILKSHGILPDIIVTNPDAPAGRKMILTESPVAIWAHEQNISAVLKPTSLKTDSFVSELTAAQCDLFIVAAYGKIIPKNILALPKYKTLNVHPSLLPQLRGASPIRSAILQDVYPTGVSIMQLTPGIDDGPLLAQETAAIPKSAWPMRGLELDTLLATQGAELLVKILPSWIAGSFVTKEQDHTKATYSSKITKEMGLLNLDEDPYTNLCKIRAFDGWPGTFFFVEKNGKKLRIKVIDAELDTDNSLRILRVVPEGKKEMLYEDFLRGM
jgi:methionyl-tRNA formyltransferase